MAKNNERDRPVTHLLVEKDALIQAIVAETMDWLHDDPSIAGPTFTASIAQLIAEGVVRRVSEERDRPDALNVVIIKRHA